MLRVVEQLSDGREQVLQARAVPADTTGPIRFAAGRIERRPVVPSPRPPLDDELCAVADAVGVLR